MAMRRLSQTLGGVLLSMAGLYLAAAVVLSLQSGAREGGFWLFARSLPGLNPGDPSGWKVVFAILFALHWFYFWAKLQRFVEGVWPALMAAASFLAVIFPVVPFFRPAPEAHAFGDFLYRLILLADREACSAVLRFGFLPTVIGNALLMVASHLGLELVDPIQAELEKDVSWPKRVPHERFLKRAARTGATYLGFEVTARRPVFLTPAARNTHVHVVGTTGSGKTLFTLFPMMRQDIEAGRGVLFIDAKGSSENARTVFRMARKAGREKDFLFFSLNDWDRSHSYNPLQHGNPSQLKDKIAASIDWSEPFYQRICESALQTLFMDLETAGRRVTLHDLRRILQSPPPQLPNFAALAEKNAREMRTLFSEIDLLVNTPFGGLLGESRAAIDLLDVYRAGKIAYFALDTQSYQHTAMRLGKMITQDVNTLSGLVESRLSAKEKRPLAVYIDEFQAFGTRGFVNALARGRSSGLWITIAHQSLGDLKSIDEEFARQVIENTNAKVFLRVNDPETAQLFSDSVGTGKTVETTSQVRIRGDEPGKIMGTQRVVHEYRIHPTELKVLAPGRAVFKHGSRYGRLSLCPYFPPDDAGPLPLPAKSSGSAPASPPAESGEQLQA